MKNSATNTLIGQKFRFYFVIFSAVFLLAAAQSAHADTESKQQPSWFPQILGLQFNGIYQNVPGFHSPLYLEPGVQPRPWAG